RRSSDLLPRCRQPIRIPSLAPHRQRRRLQRQITQGTGPARVRAGPPGHRLQALHPLPSPDLWQGRAPPPVPQALPDPPAAGHLPAGAAGAARCLPFLLQPVTSPPRPPAGRPPPQAFAARVKAGPAAELASVQYRVRHDRIDKTGAVTLRYRSRLRHHSVRDAHRNKPVRLLVAGAQVRIVTEAGELLRALTITPTRDSHPRNGRWPVHNVLRQASGIS